MESYIVEVRITMDPLEILYRYDYYDSDDDENHNSFVEFDIL